MKKIIIGKFGKSFKTAGLTKIISFTYPKENIKRFQCVFIAYPKNDWKLIKIEKWKTIGKNILTKIHDVHTPEDVTLKLTNKLIAINREQLPLLSKNKFYWTDLEGLEIINLQNKKLGIIDYLFRVASNDVIVVKNEQNNNNNNNSKNIVHENKKNLENCSIKCSQNEENKEKQKYKKDPENYDKNCAKTKLILIPYLDHVIRNVDLINRKMIVDWEE